MSQSIDSFQSLDFVQLQQEHAKLSKEFALLRDGHAALLNQLSMAIQTIADLRIENQTLRDEIARLKKTSLRPKIPPSDLEGSNKGSGNGGGNKGGPGRGKHPRSKKTGLTFHHTQRLKPQTIPEGAIFKGTRKYDVQDLVCQAYNTLYEIVGII